MSEIPLPNLNDLITDDGKPVDSIYIERLYFLLVEPLYVSWRPPGDGVRPFMAMSNVGWFFTGHDLPVAPDIMLSLDVTPVSSTRLEGRAYFQWIYGKSPDVVIEIVSNLEVDEGGERLRLYQRLGVPYYVIHDPDAILGEGELRAYQLRGRKYVPIAPNWIEEIGLGLTMWHGPFRGSTTSWLRWCDQDGKVIPTSLERLDSAKRADSAEDRIRRLVEQLRQLGVTPEA